MSFQWGQFSDYAVRSIALSDARLNIWDGAVRSGKTVSSLLAWLYFVTQAPPGPLLMAGKTVTTLKRNILDTLSDMRGRSLRAQSLSGGRIRCTGRGETAGNDPGGSLRR